MPDEHTPQPGATRGGARFAATSPRVRAAATSPPDAGTGVPREFLESVARRETAAAREIDRLRAEIATLQATVAAAAAQVPDLKQLSEAGEIVSAWKIPPFGPGSGPRVADWALLVRESVADSPLANPALSELAVGAVFQRCLTPDARRALRPPNGRPWPSVDALIEAVEERFPDPLASLHAVGQYAELLQSGTRMSGTHQEVLAQAQAEEESRLQALRAHHVAWLTTAAGAAWVDRLVAADSSAAVRAVLAEGPVVPTAMRRAAVVTMLTAPVRDALLADPQLQAMSATEEAFFSAARQVAASADSAKAFRRPKADAKPTGAKAGAAGGGGAGGDAGAARK